MQSFIRCTFAVIGSVSLASGATNLINVDMGIAGSPTYNGAGAIGSAGDQWNGIAVPRWNVSTSSTLNNAALNYSDGSASGITISMTTFYAGDNVSGSALMGDYAFIYSPNSAPGGVGTNAGPVTITLAGFAPNTMLSQLVLFGNSVSGQNSSFTIGENTLTTSGVSGANLTQGTDYVVFQDIQASESGLVEITWTNPFTSPGTDLPHSAFNGLQIMTVPEPSVALLGGIALLGLLRRRR